MMKNRNGKSMPGCEVEFKKRTGNIETWKKIQKRYKDDADVQKKMFEARAAKTPYGNPKSRKHFSFFKQIKGRTGFRC